MGKFINLKDKTFGRLKVIEKSYKDKWGQWHWNCVCNCGAKIKTSGTRLLHGKVKSCGCLQKEIARKVKFKHGFGRTKLGAIRNQMLQRCYNPNNKKYPIYGARGIEVCEEWRNDPNSFYTWAQVSGYIEGIY